MYYSILLKKASHITHVGYRAMLSMCVTVILTIFNKMEWDMKLKYQLNSIFFFWTLLPIIIMGCSALDSGIPSESLALEFLEAQVERAYPAAGIPNIESFKKTNGIKKTKDGVEMYVLEFQSEFVYPKGYMSECVDQLTITVNASELS